jgi:hypothetical protein
MTETAEPAKSKPSDIGSKSTPDTLAAFKVNPDQGLTNADVDVSPDISQVVFGPADFRGV